MHFAFRVNCTLPALFAVSLLKGEPNSLILIILNEGKLRHIPCKRRSTMKTNPRRPLTRNDYLKSASGKIGWILLWLIGIPVPVLLGLFLLRGCT